MKLIDKTIGVEISFDLVRDYAKYWPSVPIDVMLSGFVPQAIKEVRREHGEDALPNHIIITISDEDADEEEREDTKLDEEYVGACAN